jgi:hypothetical protein
VYKVICNHYPYYLLLSYLLVSLDLKLFAYKSCSLMTHEALNLFRWRCATEHSLHASSNFTVSVQLANKRGLKKYYLLHTIC